MGGRIVAAERKAHPEQAGHQPSEVLREQDQHQKHHEQRHLDDEHRLAAETVAEAAQRTRSDQDAEQAGRTNHAVLCGRKAEFLGDQRQRHAGHEDHETFKEFACDREPPYALLHARHRRSRRKGAVGPQRLLVEISLYGVAQARDALCHVAVP